MGKIKRISEFKTSTTHRLLIAHWSHSLSVANVPKADIRF
jgi:hypothetical protein